MYLFKKCLFGFLILLLCLCIPEIWFGLLLSEPHASLDPQVRLVSRFSHADGFSDELLRGSGKINKSGVVMHQPCYKVVYTWLDERDIFHVNLLFKHVRYVDKFSCPGLSCGVQIEYGQNLSKLAASDVVFLFYKSDWDWRELLKHQSDRQKWIFWTSESPRHTPHRVIPPPEYTNSTYDYIMTFRKGATNKDAYLSAGGYGHFDRSSPSVQKNDSRNWAENKTKLIAWVATNCYPNSLSYDRTGFVNALSKYVQVDKYGPCGERPCKDLATCGLQKYRFYLALENSECEDYISEKFWYTSLTLGLVPIVFGAPRENYVKAAPPNSFIFVPDFPSIRILAVYLEFLIKNDYLYNKYFEWKKEGSVKYHLQYSNFLPQSLCDNVVRRVLEDEKTDGENKRKRKRKTLVDDWDKWWTNSCNYTVSRFPIPDQ